MEGGIMSERMPISVLAPDPKNPRRISDEARAGLSVSLETFGPLDIVFNETTKQLVSGHQRIAALKSAGATELVRDGEWFYVEHPKTKERFPVRMVAWDETRQRMANLVANNPHIAGDFTEDAVAQLKELEDVEGFAELELGALEKELGDAMGSFDVDEAAAPELAEGDRQPFRQMTFTVHDEQFEEIERALARAKELGGGESLVNENSNGNALAFVCGRFNGGAG
jgi:ParB-like chromosome segregation protein Spo0J